MLRPRDLLTLDLPFSLEAYDIRFRDFRNYILISQLMFFYFQFIVSVFLLKNEGKRKASPKKFGYASLNNGDTLALRDLKKLWSCSESFASALLIKGMSMDLFA
uniref:Uncharacterized protein n=1 Tax=Glossina pallidipes TaxID=7398 RepID=A0A1A9ZTW5_GLOPL